MQLKRGEIINTQIEKLAFGGAGIGYMKSDDSKLVVFVENTIPGDKIKASLTKIKKNYLEARLEELVEKSKLRIKPRCRHFDICGGCSLQNLPYKEQLKIKEEQVYESLEHIGGFKNPPVKKIIGCNDNWFYRNKMEFSFRTDNKEGVSVGLHPKHRRYTVFQVEECFLESEDIGNLLKQIQKFVQKNNLSTYHFNSNKGLLRSIIIREGKSTDKRLINLLTSGEELKYKKEFIDLLTKNKGFKSADSIYLTQYFVQKGKKTEIKITHLYGEKFLTEKMKLENGSVLDFDIPPLAFFQPNTFQAEILYSKILEIGEIGKKDLVYDLFCGTGTIALFCAHKAKQVFGVDIDKKAIQNAKINAEKNNIKNAEFEIGDVFKIIKIRNDNPDIVIVDPPRAGLGEKLCEHLLKINIPKIIYVSCNPTTLARDLKTLCKKYVLKEAQPIDMFPHTYHIETICRLSLQKK